MGVLSGLDKVLHEFPLSCFFVKYCDYHSIDSSAPLSLIESRKLGEPILPGAYELHVSLLHPT